MRGYLLISKDRVLFSVFLVLSFLLAGQANAAECSGSAGFVLESENIGNGDGWVQIYLSWNATQTPFGYLAHASSGASNLYVELYIPGYPGSDPCFTSKIGGRQLANDISARRTMYFQATRHPESGMEESCGIKFDIPWSASGTRSNGDVGSVKIIASGQVLSVSQSGWLLENRSGTITIPAGVMQSTAQGLIGATVSIDPPPSRINIPPLEAAFATAVWKAGPIQYDTKNKCGTIVQVPAPAPSGQVVKQLAANGLSIPESSILLQEGAADLIGTITGTVISSVHVVPVDHGRVSIYDGSGLFVDSRDLQNGPYSFQNLGPGTYYLRTESTGYFDELSDDIPCLFGKCNVTDGNPISVTSGSVSFADFELDGAGDQLFFNDFESSGDE